MSASMESLPTQSASVTSASALRSMWGRLLWKDVREVVPIWLTLLFAAMLCLTVTWWMVNRSSAHIAPLYISAHTFIALCSVITGVFLFASEDENRTLHLLRNLPLPPKQIVWQKMILGSLGVVSLACFVAAITVMLASFADCDSLDSGSSYALSAANIILLPLLYLVISSASSMLSRSLFYGVLISGMICAGVILFLEPTWLGARESSYLQRSGMRWLWVALSILSGGYAVVLNASHWVEEKVVAPTALTGTAVNASQMASSDLSNLPNPFPVLLWQSYRQSRVVLACWFGLTVIGWIAIKPFVAYYQPHDTPTEVRVLQYTIGTLLWMFVTTILFASSIFVNDKHRGNYLFFQQNSERSKWFWLSRVLPFVGGALLLVLVWNFFVFNISYTPSESFRTWNFGPRLADLMNSIVSQANSQSVLVPLLTALGIIGVSQYFSMFVRNPILSFVLSGVVNVIFICLAACVVFVNESVWVFIVPMIVALYSSTWWHSKQWLATSPKRLNFAGSLLLPAVVLAAVTTAFIHHRANEFVDVELDRNPWAKGFSVPFTGEDDDGNRQTFANIEFGSDAQRQEAASLYRAAIKDLKGDFSGYHRVDPETWPAKTLAHFVAENKEAIAKIIKAAEIPVCDIFLSSDSNVRENEICALMVSTLLNTHHQLLEGNLAAAKSSTDAYDRVRQRTESRFRRYDAGYYGLLVAWAEHPDQNLAPLKSAIAQLEGASTYFQPTEIVSNRSEMLDPNSSLGTAPASFFWEFGGEKALMEMQYEIVDLQEDNENHRAIELRDGYRLMPWEYQRLTKVQQLRTLQTYRIRQKTIALERSPNDRVLRHRFGDLNFMDDFNRPYVPVDEDRGGGILLGPNPYGPFEYTIHEPVTWRRYVLLRLGLAAYRIEHGQHPNDLKQLASYYKNGLPITIDGTMFAWFKDGLGSDLIRTTYKKDQSGNQVNAGKKLADGDAPLLLPFSISDAKPIPEPIDYDSGKMGIDLWLLATQNQTNHTPPVNNSTLYPMVWSTGSR